MTASAPWSVKGIDSKAREAAKDMARRSGMTLGEWLNQMILEGGPEAQVESDPTPQRPTSRAATAKIAGGRAASRDGLARDAFAKGARRPALDLESAFGDDADELSRVTSALDTLTARIEFAESRSASAVSGINRAVETVLSRLEDTDSVVADARERLEESAEQGREAARQHKAVLESQSKLAERIIGTERISVAHAERLEGLSAHLKAERERIARIEQEIAHPRSLEAVRTMEVALGKLANQLYEGETRTRASLSDVREDLAGLSQRVGAVERHGNGTDVRAMVEGIVAQVAQRLEAAEARTSSALRTLESSFAALDARLTQTEARGDVTDPDDLVSPRETLTRLAEDLTRRVDLARAEMLERLDTTSQHRFDRVDRALSDLNAHIGDVEKQSARAIERMGQDVLRIADNLNRRVSGVEANSAAAMAQVGGDVRRLAEIMDSRLGQSDSAHSQALEKLGSEIARISEKLTVRIADTERRTARAIDELGDQLGGATEAIDARYARAATDLAERIRQSEERTAKTLQDARERIEARLEAVQSRPESRAATNTAQTVSSVEKTPVLRSESKPDPLSFPDDFGPLPSAFAASDMPLSAKSPILSEGLDAVESDLLAGSDPFEADDQGIIHGAIPTQAPRLDDVTFDETDEAALMAVPASAPMPAQMRYDAEDEDNDVRVPAPQSQSLKPADDPFDDDDGPDAALAAELKALAGEIGDLPPEPFSRAVSDMAPPPVVARAQGSESSSESTSAEQDADDDLFADPQPALSTRDALAAARAAVRSSLPVEEERSAGFLSGLKLGKSKTRLKDFGASEEKAKNSTLLRAFKASAVAVALTTVAVSSAVIFGDDIRNLDNGTGKDKAPKPDEATPRLPLVATAVTPTQSSAPVDPLVLARDYQAAADQLKSRDKQGVDTIRRLANLGYAPAQFHLGRLYEGEASGLVKADPIEARRWTERAAMGGDPRAMHNLGLMMFSGVGGAQDPTTAAQWFRKAADRGIVDSQFNLGVMYQEGTGLPLDPAEAYKWLMIASRNGDREATKAAKALVSRLEPAQESAARLAADRFQPITEIPSASVSEKVAMR